MPVVGFDHVALPTSDAERFIEFYKRLGFEIIDEEQWRRSEARTFAIRIGESKINVHPPGLNAVNRSYGNPRMQRPVLRMGWQD